MRHGFRFSKALAGASLAVLLFVPSLAFARAGLGYVPAPGLGSAAGFALLAGTTITIAGDTGIGGDVGVSPGTAITGMPKGQPTNGNVHAGDPIAAQAQADLAGAYATLVGMACDSVMTGVPLGGATLTRGVHCFAAIAGLAGTLTLDAEGDTSAVFIFQVGSGLNVDPGALVTLTNGAQARHVWWQVGSSAVLATSSTMVGNVIALTSITLESGASLEGRALARGGAVTMDTYSINSPGDTGTPATATTWGALKSRYR
jgi:hypothetical protein